MRSSQDNLESQRVRGWRKGCWRDGHCAKDKDLRGGHLRKESFLVAQISTSILKTPTITCSWFQHCSLPPLLAWNLGSYLISCGYEIWCTSRGKSYIKSVVPLAHFPLNPHWTSAHEHFYFCSLHISWRLACYTEHKFRRLPCIQGMFQAPRAAVDREALPLWAATLGSKTKITSPRGLLQVICVYLLLWFFFLKSFERGGNTTGKDTGMGMIGV